MEKDYYKILGISEEEKKLKGDEFRSVLKKKYRDLSKKLHPDAHVNDTEENKKAAEEEFKLVSEANAVLSNDAEREKYDNGGFNLEEFLSKIGGMGGMFGGMFGSMFGGQQQPVYPHITLHVTLKEILDGGFKEVVVSDEVCPECKGRGTISSFTQNGGICELRRYNCPRCNGSGRIPSSDVKRISVPIIKGAYTGFNITLNTPFGKHIVDYVVIDDPDFIRISATDIGRIEYVPFNKCLLGTSIPVKMIDGGVYYFNVPECTKDGDLFEIKGIGLPEISQDGNGKRGICKLVIKYTYPEKLTEEQKELLKKF